MQAKTVAESAIHDQTSVVFPNDLNAYGTLFGGRVLDLCDRVAGVVAMRHSGKVCVTLGIDSVRFLAPAKHGDILVFINRGGKQVTIGASEAKSNRSKAFRTSETIAERLRRHEKVQWTFVVAKQVSESELGGERGGSI